MPKMIVWLFPGLRCVLLKRKINTEIAHTIIEKASMRYKFFPGKFDIKAI